jgi:hypothetical protein
MEKVTMRATRVTINAKKGTILKDPATAGEIINQLEKSLALEKFPAPEKSPVKRKGRSMEKSMSKNEPTISARPSFVGFQEGFQ